MSGKILDKTNHWGTSLVHLIPHGIHQSTLIKQLDQDLRQYRWSIPATLSLDFKKA